jgi:hypothetical protein
MKRRGGASSNRDAPSATEAAGVLSCIVKGILAPTLGGVNRELACYAPWVQKTLIYLPSGWAYD